MARLRFLAVAALALAVAGSPTRAGKPEGKTWVLSTETPRVGKSTAEVDASTCVIYPLSEMGYDADLGKWIAQTIPEVIEPGSWKDTTVLRFYAPKNILVVRHSAAVQAKVDSFLKNMKSSLAKGKGSSRPAGEKWAGEPAVAPAEYRAPAVLRTSSPLPESTSYPVPAPVKPPKHLFHFLIRYEGEGIIDDSVVKFLKVYSQADKKEKETNSAPVTAGCPAPSRGISISAPASLPAVAPKDSEDKEADKKETADKKPSKQAG